MGASVDLSVPRVSSFEVGRWLARHTDFDRLYLYDPDRPLHVSCGPERARAIVRVERRAGGQVVPRRLTLEGLEALSRGEGASGAAAPSGDGDAGEG
jgi:hypothetical protein